MMKSRLEKTIERFGIEVCVEGSDGLKRGRAVILPMRYRQKQWGGVEHTAEGRTEPHRYLMFCGRELVSGCGYGSLVFQSGQRFVMIWKDEYSTKGGGYARVCMRKTNGE